MPGGRSKRPRHSGDSEHDRLTSSAPRERLAHDVTWTATTNGQMMMTIAGRQDRQDQQDRQIVIAPEPAPGGASS